MPPLDEEITIGAREAKQKMAAETIRNIKNNRSLIALQLTDEEPISPEIMHDVQNMEDAFNRLDPCAEFEFEDKDGNVVTEKMRFKSIEDMTPKGIAKKSSFISAREQEFDTLTEWIRQCKSNKALKKVIEDPESRSDFLAALDSYIDEIQD